MVERTHAPVGAPDLLRVAELVVAYGRSVVLDGVDLRVGRGELVALVGPNGAGKSTLVNTVCGLVTAASGRIERHGVFAQVPEGRQLFAELSVDDNLRLGAWRRRGRRDTSTVYELFPDLARLRRQAAGRLSGGQQQMVSIGRALMAEPELLVIDELSLGLAPLVVADLAEHLTSLNRERGTAVLLVEQEVGLAFELCTRAYLLEAGRVVLEGSTARLAEDPRVRAAYLGGLDADGDGLRQAAAAVKELPV